MSNLLTPRILIVDDQFENRLLMTEYLDDLGVEVEEAENGQQCLDMLKLKDYTLVILDIQMPGLNGFEVLEIMRKDEKLIDVPVVFVSTIYDSDQHIIKGITGGAIDFIAKPVNIDILKSKVSNFIKFYDKQTKLDQAVKNLEFTNQQLSANKRKLKGITDSASDAIILLDSNFLISFWNKASTSIFGYTKFEVLSENFFDKLIAPESRDSLVEKFKSHSPSHKKSSDKSMRLIAINKSGIEFPAELSFSSFILDNRGNRYTVILRDITHHITIEKEALKAKELREANKMIKEFMDNVSHELRTPMNAILGISNMLLKYNADNLQPKQVEGLQIINQSGTRLLDLINDVLDIAKLESGKITVFTEEFDLENMLASLRSLVISLIDNKDIRFLILKSPHVPQVITTDKKKLNQILLNLLSNAVKFTEKGKIQLFIHFKDEKLIFEVTDTGIGISEENQAIIFERFRQIDTSGSKEYKGTGLGLNICKGYIEIMGGEISVESTLGKGTSMTFNIPVQNANVKPVREKKYIPDNLLTEQIESAINSDLPIALIIDDNKQNNFWYSSLFKEHNYAVLSYLNSSAGLMAIKQFLPDIVLLKYEMPKLHGQYILKQAQKLDITKSSQFIVISTIDNSYPQKTNFPCKIINEPITEKSLSTVIEETNNPNKIRPNIKHLFLYTTYDHIKDIEKASANFYISSLSAAILTIKRRQIDSLILDGISKNGIHQELITWLSENPSFVPEKIILVTDIKRENDPSDHNLISDNIPEILKSKVEIYNYH